MILSRFPQRVISVLPLIALGVLIEAACLEIVRIGDLRTSLASVMLGDRPVTILVFWLPFVAAFLPYLIAVAWTGPHPLPPSPNTRSRGTGSESATPSPLPAVGEGPGVRGPFLVIILFAVLFRVTLLFSPSTLSDDIYRYVWDGRTQHYGINPYRYPPNAPELAGLRDAYYHGINNKPISTIYPPLMEMVFRAVDAVVHAPMAMKVTFVLCDLGLITLISLLLRVHGLSIVRALIYAWNPLVLVEVAGSGHHDPLAVGLMLAALLALTTRRSRLAVVYLALSFVAKLFSVVLIPSFARTMSRKTPLLLFPLLVIVLYLPYLDAGHRLFTGLLVYGNKWRFNDSLFTLALSATGSLLLAKVVVGTLFLVCVIARCIGQEFPLRTAYVLIGAYLVLSPTLHSWYLLWIIPFLCFFPNRAWLLLSGLAMLSYNVLVQSTQTGIWREALWVRYVEFVPFYALLLFDRMKPGERTNYSSRISPT